MKKFFFLTLILLITGILVIFNFALAVSAPTVTFLGGDDILQNGGMDDSYDSLIIFRLATGETGLTGWEMDYSKNGGDSWISITSTYDATEDKYFWSTSLIYAPTLLFRARSEHAGVYSEYVYETLALSHRQINNGAHYFVESFTDSIYKDESTNASWNTELALLELPPNPPNYHPNGQAISTNLLFNTNNRSILGVTFQTVQWDYTKEIEYQVSNNGLDWYGDTSGVPKNNTWFSWPLEVVPDAVYVPFDDTIGDGLYWQAKLKTNRTTISPTVFQMRFDWQENYSPQACFLVEPTMSINPNQEFVFNASCSTDYEDSYQTMDYRWDFNNDGTWELDWQQGRYNPSYIYGSTSTQEIVLEVRDTFNVVDGYTGQINASGTPSGIIGWAWSSNYGWTSLNCDNTYYNNPLNLCPPIYGLTLNTNNSVTGWVWDNNLGWICFGSTCEGYGDPPLGGNTLAIYDTATGEISGWAKYLVYGDQSVDGWVQLRGNWCDAGPDDDMCVYVDLTTHRIFGYAWNGFETAGVAQGVGWIKFFGNVSVPWLETKYGQVYGQDDVGSAQTFGSPDNRYTSTYCIRANGDIINFSSESNCEETAYNDLGYPLPNNKYRTILGIINFGTILNSYEKVEYENSDVDASLSGVISLDNKVYNFIGEDDYYISEPITFNNARNLDSSGAGTIIINGNLHINSNLFYESSAVTSKIENLASVAWIVTGDVIIDEMVSSVVGNFVIVGPDPSVPCDEPGPSGCGEFRTGDDSASPRQLVVNGLVIARKMYFERYFKQAGEPAEKIIYDGRVMVNTPPGLENVTKGLPVWREATVSTNVE